MLWNKFKFHGIYSRNPLWDPKYPPPAGIYIQELESGRYSGVLDSVRIFPPAQKSEIPMVFNNSPIRDSFFGPFFPWILGIPLFLTQNGLPFSLTLI